MMGKYKSRIMNRKTVYTNNFISIYQLPAHPSPPPCHQYEFHSMATFKDYSKQNHQSIRGYQRKIKQNMYYSAGRRVENPHYFVISTTFVFSGFGLIRAFVEFLGSHWGLRVSLWLAVFLKRGATFGMFCRECFCRRCRVLPVL